MAGGKLVTKNKTTMDAKITFILPRENDPTLERSIECFYFLVCLKCSLYICREADEEMEITVLIVVEYAVKTCCVLMN